MIPRGTLRALVLTAGSLVVFLTVFTLDYRYNLARAELLGRTHVEALAVILRTGDDLALIDWAQRLPIGNGLSAWEALDGPKIMAQTGRMDLLNRSPWFGRLTGMRTLIWEDLVRTNTQQTVKIRIAVKTDPGPVAWGVFAVILFLTGSAVQGSLEKRAAENASRIFAASTASPPTCSAIDRSKQLSPANQDALLILDGRWNVLFATQAAEDLFGGPILGTSHPHLLPLGPTPGLLAVLEKGQKELVNKGFNRLPGIPTEINPLPGGGFILLLENSSPGKLGKNH